MRPFRRPAARLAGPGWLLLSVLGGCCSAERRECGSSNLGALGSRGGACTGDARKLLQQESVRAPQFEMCPMYKYIYSGPTMDSIFDELTQQEYVSVTDFVADAYGFLVPAGGYADSSAVAAAPAASAAAGVGGAGGGIAQTPALNTNISQFENYIYNVFLYPVNKGEALRYLDLGGEVPKRYAKVIAVRGGEDPPDVMEYKVGPLPLGPGSSVQPLLQDGTIPYVKRPPNDLPEAAALGEWANAVMTLLKDLFIDFLGQCGAVNDPDCQGNNITAFNVASGTREDGKTRVALILHYYSIGHSAAYDLHNIPFAYKVNTTKQDFVQWDVFEFEFCGQGFADAYALADAYTNGTVKICNPSWVDPNYSPLWSTLQRQGGPPRAGMDRPGPRLYEPAGKRFSLLQGDSNTSRVFQWGGWQAHVTTNPWTGPSFHDVRFQGERILFELSLNDQMVAYSGYSSVGQTYYLDAFDQIGGSQYTLRPGYDCPETATYMPLNVVGPYGQQISYSQSVCFFEGYTGETSWRHFDFANDGTPQAESIRNYEFVMRAVSTLGNYDYIISVHFQLDGSIRCKVQMAGYMQTIYYDTEYGFSGKESAYGTRVHEHTIGNLHDHLSSWKVDLDVGGTNNSFHIKTIKTGTYEEVWGTGATPPWGSASDVMKYEVDQQIEREAGYKLSYKEPAYFRFVNPNMINSWGVARGYGIFHGHTTQQLLPDSHPLTKAAAWSKYHIAVTRRKEDEATSSKDYYDSHSPGYPIWSLDMALNNESIVGEDLVAWVSMGIQHSPRSEDVPIISNVGCDFTIKPVNYFEGLPSMNVFDSDAFKPCAAPQGREAFDYNYSAAGQNRMVNKSGFKVTGPLNSRDIFQASPQMNLPARAGSPPQTSAKGPAQSDAAAPASKENRPAPSPTVTTGRK